MSVSPISLALVLGGLGLFLAGLGVFLWALSLNLTPRRQDDGQKL